MTVTRTRLTSKAKQVEKSLRMSVQAVRKPSKYRNTPVVHDGIRFASKAEGRRYLELKLLERAGKIKALSLQAPYKLRVNGVVVCKYLADFCYLDMTVPVDGDKRRMTVEDVKGMLTPEFKLKAKMFEAQEGFPITIIKA